MVCSCTGGCILSSEEAPIREVCWMDNGETLHFAQDPVSGVVAIDFTPYPYGTHMVVRVAEIQVA